MIQLTSSATPETAADMVLLPNRSLTRAGLWGFVALQSLVALGFALLAAWQGNVFAPLFAIMEIGVVAWCLRRVWSSSACGEIIRMTPEQIAVLRTDGAPVASFHPYWARLTLQPGSRGGSRRLLLGSHGRFVEIGAFLRDDERRELAQQLATLLGQRAPDGTKDFEKGEANEAWWIDR